GGYSTSTDQAGNKALTGILFGGKKYQLSFGEASAATDTPSENAREQLTRYFSRSSYMEEGTAERSLLFSSMCNQSIKIKHQFPGTKRDCRFRTSRRVLTELAPKSV